MSQSYQLQLSQFQGPLELLLHLIEERRLDITRLSLLEVTDQYLAYLYATDHIDLDALADFLVIAARLLLLKSSRLLPQAGPLLEEGAEDSGAELARMLQDYQRLQGAVPWLRAQEEKGLRAYARLPSLSPSSARRPLVPLPPTDLLQAILSLRRRVQSPLSWSVPRQLLSLSEKIDEIRQALARWRRLTFQQLVGTVSREVCVVTFLAVLELLKGRQVTVAQEEPFGEIMILPMEEGRERAGDSRGGEEPIPWRESNQPGGGR